MENHESDDDQDGGAGAGSDAYDPEQVADQAAEFAVVSANVCMLPFRSF
jgi:hypothetical protein